jgi:hypothetical protein
MINGSCLCGQVTYEIHGEMGPITHCHCPTCRKAHASAFSSISMVQLNDLNFTSGKELLKYHESSPGKKRFFCSNCGSQIYAKREDQNHYIFRMGTIDFDPGVRPTQHIFVRYKAPWYNIHDEFPEYPEWPPHRSPSTPTIPAGYEKFFDSMEEILRLAARKRSFTSLLLIDATTAGNEIEQNNACSFRNAIEKKIEENVRDSDQIELLGESTYAVLLPYTDAKAALILAERIRNMAKAISHETVTSIGVATLQPDQLNSMDLTTGINDILMMVERACRSSKEKDADRAIHFDGL